MRDFRELKVWERSHKLTLEVYRATSHFPKEELYGLTSQIRRASASVPANIAEGCGRNGVAELGRFFNIAMGSASELEYHLLLAHDLGFLGSNSYKELSELTVEVKRMLGSYLQKLKTEHLAATNGRSSRTSS
jgi:four helix bundle protein